MDMKWNPIIDGDLSGIPRDERLLFTGIDCGELYVDFGYIESRLGDHVFVYSGDNEIPIESKEFIAWMEIPEPYQPGRCDICKHWKEWIDNFGDRWSKCELMEIGTFVPLQKCPLKK